MTWFSQNRLLYTFSLYAYSLTFIVEFFFPRARSCMWKSSRFCRMWKSCRRFASRKCLRSWATTNTSTAFCSSRAKICVSISAFKRSLAWWTTSLRGKRRLFLYAPLLFPPHFLPPFSPPPFRRRERKKQNRPHCLLFPPFPLIFSPPFFSSFFSPSFCRWEWKKQNRPHWRIFLPFLSSDPLCSKQNLRLLQYSIVPLNKKLGILSMLKNSVRRAVRLFFYLWWCFICRRLSNQ